MTSSGLCEEGIGGNAGEVTGGIWYGSFVVDVQAVVDCPLGGTVAIIIVV